MQPRCRQVPPLSALSISAADRLMLPAGRAAASAPLPAPRMTMSKVPPFGWLTLTPEVGSSPGGSHHGNVTVRPGHLVTCGTDQCSQVPCKPASGRTLAAIERKERAVAWFRRRREPSAARVTPVDQADLEHLAR